MDKKIKVLVVDAQGGGIGKTLCSQLKDLTKDIDITAVGTNSVATNNMLKAGAHHGATGENAVVVNSRKADIIIGPMGIIMADSMYGEVTEKMALSIIRSEAKRILIPFKHEDLLIMGVNDYNLSALVKQALEEVIKTIDSYKK